MILFSAPYEYRLCTSNTLHVLVIQNNRTRTGHPNFRTIAACTLNELRLASCLNKHIWKEIATNRRAAPPEQVCRELTDAHAEYRRKHPTCNGVRWNRTPEGWTPTHTTHLPEHTGPATPPAVSSAALRSRPSTLPNPAPHAQLPSSVPVVPRATPNCPPSEIVAVATDASGLGSWAAVIRQGQRTFRIGSHSAFHDHPAEMHAIVAALEWLPGRHEHIEILSDSQPAIHALTTPARPLKKKHAQNEEKQQRRQQILELTKRYRAARDRHGCVVLIYRPRTTPEIAVVDALARRLGEVVKAQRLRC